MPVLNIADAAYLGIQPVLGIYVGQIRVWPEPDGLQPQVTNVSSAGTLTLTWAEAPLAISYEIRRNGDLIATQEDRVYNDSGLVWDGTYSYTITPLYDGSTGLESTPSVTITVPAGVVGEITPSNQSTSSLTIKWAKVPGATEYQIDKSGATATQTKRSRALTIANDTTYDIKVRAKRDDVYGPWSTVYTYYSGRDEIRDQGSKSGLVFSPTKVDSWRSFDGWSALSNLAGQGIFTAGRGSYRGVIYYGSNGVRNSLRGKLSSNSSKAEARQLKGKCTKAELYLYKRPNVGTSGPVQVGIQRTNSTASGGAPSGTDNVNRTSTNNGQGKWYDIGKGHGQAVGDGDKKSLMIRKDGYPNLRSFLGLSSSSFLVLELCDNKG